MWTKRRNEQRSVCRQSAAGRRQVKPPRNNLGVFEKQQEGHWGGSRFNEGKSKRFRGQGRAQSRGPLEAQDEEFIIYSEYDGRPEDLLTNSHCSLKKWQCWMWEGTEMKQRERSVGAFAVICSWTQSLYRTETVDTVRVCSECSCANEMGLRSEIK